MTPAELAYSADGLLPVVVQHYRSGEVLMVAFANQEAVQRTLDTQTGWFWSRSRGKLWHKGETSGHLLQLRGLRVDCDGDALIYLVDPIGPTCHTGERTCFHNRLDGVEPGETNGEAAAVLSRTIAERQAAADPGSSYTARLLAGGVDRVAKKVGEEAAEVIIAAKNGDRAEMAYETADLWFHTYVLLALQGMRDDDVWDELRGRRK